MGNIQPIQTGNEQGSQADISGDSTKSVQPADTGNVESVNTSNGTPASMLNDSQETWTNAELRVLRLKAGLVAGALAEFQDARGKVKVVEVETAPGEYSLKVLITLNGLSIRRRMTPDGLDFEILPLANAANGTT